MGTRGSPKNVLLAPGSYKSIDLEENFVPNYIDLRNGYMTDRGAYHRRLGYLQKNNLGTNSSTDLLIPDLKTSSYAVSDNRIFNLTSDSTSTELPGQNLQGTKRPYEVKSGSTFVICDGGPPVKIVSGVASLLLGSPSNFKRIFNLGDYHIGIGHHDTEIKWSAANNIENWIVPGAPVSGDSGFANVTKTGVIKNGIGLKRRAMIFKNNEIEVWINRGGAIQFVPIDTIEKGIYGDGDSLVKQDNALYWLGDDKRFYRLDGVTPVPISSPMERYIQSFVNAADCYGFDCKKEHVIRWFFPTDGKTLVYDYKNSSPERPIWWEENTWCNAQFERMPFKSYMELDGKQFFGSFGLDGLIHEWSKDHLTDNGLPIREFRHFSIEPGDRQFRFNKVGFYLKRGVATVGVPNPNFMWRSKTDRETTWGQWAEVDMGDVGDTDPYVPYKNLGRGRNIEFQIALSHGVETFLRKMDLTAKELRR